MIPSVLCQLPVWALSLGCPKNRVDTEKLLGSLGIPVRLVKHLGKSKVIFINTCAFIEPAARESIREILAITERVKTLKHKPLIVVAGCLPGRYGKKELRKEIPEVDLWLSPDELSQWPALLLSCLKQNPHSNSGRFFSSPLPYAWLKIADGCNHNCSFCTIPSFRGLYRSESAPEILAEAANLLERGVKELILVAQDLTMWGKSGSNFNSRVAGNSQNLTDLLASLAELKGLRWLRMLYLYPATLEESLLRFVASHGLPVLPYFDIPFQHSESRILASMGRPFSINPRDLVEKIRSLVPGCALRSTFIVGYPGETDKDFENLCEFVSQARFTNMGVFTFHCEDGTVASSLPDQIPEEIKVERKRILMEIQANISRDFLAQFVGKKMSVLVDASDFAEWPGLYKGRVWFQAPEIDGISYISGPDVKVGAMCEAAIQDSGVYDLSALN